MSTERKSRRAAPADLEAGQPWWRFGFMWLVVGGPLVVVVAGIVTAVIALQGADDILEPGAARARSGSQAPALKARNHVATPER